MILPDITDETIDRGRFPVDPWRLVERVPHTHDLGVTETLFTVGNGYLGMRGNPEEGRDAHTHGTFVNGFHETWEIRHAESAFGFARTGQTIVNVPDVKVLKIYVDDEPLIVRTADLEHYERTLDFREGVLRRSLVWRTPAGKRVRVDSTRMVSMTQRHLSLHHLEVTMLEGDAPIVISSQTLNRQDGGDEYRVKDEAMGAGHDPRKAGSFDHRVLLPRLRRIEDGRATLGYQCANSGMTIAVATDHVLVTEDEHEVVERIDDDRAKTTFRIEARAGHTVRLTKAAAYHTSRGVPATELADRCDRTLDRVRRNGADVYLAEQRAWFDRFWTTTDVRVDDNPGVQQAIRYNLFQLAQASARADQQGVPAKGVSGSGYEGHYFWDTEIYVAPFLTYTQPGTARNILHFRCRMLPAARERARELAQVGALFPWRTINGEEASAYYAAGTAQVHIDADVAYALTKYVDATGDEDFLVRDGVDVLVETARLWADLGFWRHQARPGLPPSGTPERDTVGDPAQGDTFHIHGVTGPDEYTTVVNNNLFTNVMARYNLERAADAVEQVRAADPGAYQQLVARLRLADHEVEEWRQCAAGMVVPYDETLGIHPQDEHFLDREVWDLSQTPAELRPLLLHYHPLVIYRFQVLKQADVVLALFLQGDRFTAAEKRADFEYYDPITTGDSTLSSVVQSVIAAEVGYHEAAYQYFLRSLFVDLLDLHHNTVDGLHIASAGGVWSALVFGFGGLRDHGGRLRLDPRLPDAWPALSFPLTWHGTRIRVRLERAQVTLEVEEVAEGSTGEVPVLVRGAEHVVTAGSPVVVALADQGPRIPGTLGDQPLIGGHRADGTEITAGVPSPSHVMEEAHGMALLSELAEDHPH